MLHSTKPAIISTTPPKSPMKPLATPIVQITPAWQVSETGGPDALRISPRKPPTVRLNPSATTREPPRPRSSRRAGLRGEPRSARLIEAAARIRKNSTAARPTNKYHGATPVAPSKLA